MLRVSYLVLVGLAVRLIVGGVLGLGGIAKLALPDRARRTWLESYQLFPSRTLAPAAVVIPVAEVAISAALLTGAFGWVSDVAAAALIAAFTVAVGVTLVRGRHPECGCFGRLSKELISLPIVVRNSVFVGSLLFAALFIPIGASSVALSMPLAAAVVALIGGGALLASSRHLIKEGRFA